MNNNYNHLEKEISRLSERVKNLKGDYSKVSLKNDELQSRLQKQNDQATNDEPLIRLKKAKGDIQKEIKKMDVRIGVLNNIVWKHLFLRRRGVIDQVLSGGRPGDNYGDLPGIQERLEDLQESEEDY